VAQEVSFVEIRTKQVVNVIDGKALGRICDVVFSKESSRVLGFVVPGETGLHLFRKKGDIFIPYDRVIRIGIDTILVELRPYNGEPPCEQVLSLN
jgi:YlmC/YmxH family sporulation protein